MLRMSGGRSQGPSRCQPNPTPHASSSKLQAPGDQGTRRRLHARRRKAERPPSTLAFNECRQGHRIAHPRLHQSRIRLQKRQPRRSRRPRPGDSPRGVTNKESKKHKNSKPRPTPEPSAAEARARATFSAPTPSPPTPKETSGSPTPATSESRSSTPKANSSTSSAPLGRQRPVQRTSRASPPTPKATSGSPTPATERSRSSTPKANLVRQFGSHGAGNGQVQRTAGHRGRRRRTRLDARRLGKATPDQEFSPPKAPT